MNRRTRREFLADVGRGMLVAGVGAAAAADLDLLPRTFADDPGSGRGSDPGDEPARLDFGDLEPLVRLFQETPVDRLLPLLAEKLKAGADLRRMVSAAALANARTFGGEDYVGFHTLMALAPSFHMAGELPDERRHLPVFKVLYRNTSRIQEAGGRKSEVLRLVKPAGVGAGAADSATDAQGAGDVLRAHIRRGDVRAAEEAFAAIARGSVEGAFNALLVAVEDHTEVHRVVLPYRAWELLGIVGSEHAHTLLRQSVRYCVKSGPREPGAARAALEKALDRHGLSGRAPGSRAADDAWVDRTSRLIFDSGPDEAADAAAAALAEGMAPDAVAEAISLAANQLVLRDAGRPARHASAAKPAGSVHGDSVGVHACDAVNAWRNIARVADPRNAAAATILAAWEVARDRSAPGWEVDFLAREPLPYAADLERIVASDAGALLRELDGAVREKDQSRASAVVHRYGGLGHEPRPVFDLLLAHAISQDGALHAEKYYRTVCEEFASTRPAFRWRQLVALARVTASEYGFPAPGYEEATRILGPRVAAGA